MLVDGRGRSLSKNRFYRNINSLWKEKLPTDQKMSYYLSNQQVVAFEVALYEGEYREFSISLKHSLTDDRIQEKIGDDESSSFLLK